MNTLYDLFKVKEDATQEEIKESYNRILQKADSLPQNDKIIEQVRRIKIAYGILSDPEKRKRYDSDLATKRADELLEKVHIKEPKSKKGVENEPERNVHYTKKKIPEIDEARIRNAIDKQVDSMIETANMKKLKEEADRRKEEQLEEQLKKQEKRQLRKDKRQAKKELQMKREMEIQAYGEFLEKQGYKVKYPWTWPRVKRLLISIIAVIIVLFIIWHIPFVRQTLTNLYNENFIIQTLVNIVISIFKSISEAIKSIFK